MHTVVETDAYLDDAKHVGLTKDERDGIIEYMATHPRAGVELRGTGGARKVRFAAKGKGKSGGVRVITFYSGREIPVFLLSVFSKNEKIDLTQGEKKELKQVLGDMVHAYKKRKH